MKEVICINASGLQTAESLVIGKLYTVLKTLPPIKADEGFLLNERESLHSSKGYTAARFVPLHAYEDFKAFMSFLEKYFLTNCLLEPGNETAEIYKLQKLIKLEFKDAVWVKFIDPFEIDLECKYRKAACWGLLWQIERQIGNDATNSLAVIGRWFRNTPDPTLRSIGDKASDGVIQKILSRHLPRPFTIVLS